MTQRFYVSRIFEETNGSELETDEAAFLKPTRYFGVGVAGTAAEGTPTRDKPGPVVYGFGEINRISWRMNPANAVTYRLQVYESNSGATGSEENLSHLLFDSTEVVAACVDDVFYDAHELVRPFYLRTSIFWYILDWSAAPGNTTGMISISGKREGLKS